MFWSIVVHISHSTQKFQHLKLRRLETDCQTSVVLQLIWTILRLLRLFLWMKIHFNHYVYNCCPTTIFLHGILPALVLDLMPKICLSYIVFYLKKHLLLSGGTWSAYTNLEFVVASAECVNLPKQGIPIKQKKNVTKQYHEIPASQVKRIYPQTTNINGSLVDNDIIVGAPTITSPFST